MIKFACGSCRADFEAEDYQQGQEFPCTTCGAPLKVPGAGAIPPVRPVASSAGEGTRVRFIHRGAESSAFRTTASTTEIYQAIEEMLQRLGLRVDSDWGIYGMINHSLSFFCEIKVDGIVDQRKGGQEVILDLNWRPHLPVAAILIAIFIFPVGLVLALVFYNQSQNDVRRMVDEKFDAVSRRLEAGRER